MISFAFLVDIATDTPAVEAVFDTQVPIQELPVVFDFGKQIGRVEIIELVLLAGLSEGIVVFVGHGYIEPPNPPWRNAGSSLVEAPDQALYDSRMKFFLLSLSIVLVLPLSASLAQEKAAAKKKPNPVLQPIEDEPGLPRVLLIGDSISMGYTLPVREKLKGKANVHRIRRNGGPTSRGLDYIDQELGEKKWDLIHFNWGIHDLRHMEDGKAQVKAADYEANLRKLVARLKETGATLIWAAITPIPENPLKNDRYFENEDVYNEIAAKVMKENGIHINDLHTYMQPRFEEFQIEDDLHYKPEGSEFLAEKVAAEIASAL